MERDFLFVLWNCFFNCIVRIRLLFRNKLSVVIYFLWVVEEVERMMSVMSLIIVE